MTTSDWLTYSTTTPLILKDRHVDVVEFRLVAASVLYCLPHYANGLHGRIARQSDECNLSMTRSHQLPNPCPDFYVALIKYCAPIVGHHPHELPVPQHPNWQYGYAFGFEMINFRKNNYAILINNFIISYINADYSKN